MSHDRGAESSAAFRAYVQHFGLSLRDVALAASVRMLTVWKIEQGLPIREADALAVCAGLHHLTGVPYTTLIPIIPAEILLMIQVSQAGNKP
jgi:transcriptional regulator with XRE-family HTH domain